MDNLGFMNTLWMSQFSCELMTKVYSVFRDLWLSLPQKYARPVHRHTTISPVGAYPWVVSNLIVVHPGFTFPEKPLLGLVSSDTGSTRHRLLKVGVDGGAGDGFQSLELTRGGHIHTLQGSDRCRVDRWSRIIYYYMY